MADRDIYLRIEPVPGYSPVDPDPMAPIEYRRDCMYNHGHEDGRVPITEANARRVDAIVYREYYDPGYLIPVPDKIVDADINEPAFHSRVPGAVLYAHPGERLHIHVKNADSTPHSLHMHGLRYGADSDGSWPFGTQSTDGRRSDEICPNDSWTYTYDVTADMVGAWPFHEHWQHISDHVNRGLFGGLVVLPTRVRQPPRWELPKHIEELIKVRLAEGVGAAPLAAAGGHAGMAAMGAMPGMGGDGRDGRGPGGAGAPPVLPELPRDLEFVPIREMLHHLVYVPGGLHPLPPRPRPLPTLHVPIFFHLMSGPRSTPVFRSPFLNAGDQFTQAFPAEGVFDYYCEIHGQGMAGVVRVQMGGPVQAAVTASDNQFVPPDVTIGPGGTVVWTNAGPSQHSVLESGGTNLATYCLNGRAFIGNTPTIVAYEGQKIRWYVFDLDLGMNWHNFHPHSQRWNFGGEPIDIRSLGPAESFVVDTVAPPPVLLPDKIESKQTSKRRRPTSKQYDLEGDFLFHCHVEMHMMQGMAGLVRSRRTVWLTDAEADEVRATSGLPLSPGTNTCPPVDLDRCSTNDAGRWEEVPGNPEVTFMHACLLPETTQVLYWGYTRADQSRLWDYGAAPGYSAPPNQPADLAPTPPDPNWSNLWSAEHAFLDLPEGTLLAHGGFSLNNAQAFLFNPATSQWSTTNATVDGRFYATTLTLADGRILTLFGSGLGPVSRTVEVYTFGTGWAPPVALPATFDYLYYPWTFLLPGGELFIAGPTGVTRRFDWAAPVDDPAKRWNTIAGNRSTGGEKGTAVLLPLRPPDYDPKVLIAGGNTPTAQSTAEIIDLSAPTPSWSSLANLNEARPEQVQSVLLPDGRVFVCGGVPSSGGTAEIFDPSNPAAGWQVGPAMSHVRGYHSAAILLPDGSVVVGGDPQVAGAPTPHERFFPGYCFRIRPVITNAPPIVQLGDTFDVDTPQAADITEVVLLRPGAVTHGFNMSQRFVACAITSVAAGQITVEAPPDGNVAPPGHYLLFVVDSNRTPSVASWIRLTS